jgi:alkylhydroperoxidase family enzyme
MAWIKTISPDEAEGELKQIYEEQKNRAGAVANILQIHSLAPNVLAAHLDIYKAAMHGSGELSRVRREMVAVAVSQANGCHY